MLYMYVVTYFKVSTFIHTFAGDDMHCKVLCITESDIVLVPKNLGFLKTELLWKPNFKGGPETIRFSQIIL